MAVPSMDSAARTPSRSALLHPIALAAWAVLLLNDHLLKRWAPGVVTGKLSDFAGLLLLPLFLHTCFTSSHARLFRRPPTSKAAERALVVSIFVSVLGFTLLELWPAADTMYEVGLGVLQWPFRVAWALLSGRSAPGLARVAATADATDLIALPMAGVPYLLAGRLGLSDASATQLR